MSDSEQRKKGLAGVFTRSAATYDSFGPRFFAYFGRKLVELAQLSPGAHVLDVATGRGAVLFRAVEQVGPQGHVTGIDIAEGMVEATNREIQQRHIPNAEARQMDAENLDFPDASFDVLFNAFSLFMFPQPEQALAEFRRVLKPGGRIIIATWGRDDENWKWMGELYQKYGSPPGSQPPPPPPPPAAPRPVFNTAEGMQEVMQKAGFQDVQVVSDDPEFTFADEDEWLAVQWSHGGRFFLERIPPDRFDSWKAEAFTQLRQMRRTDGIPQEYAALLTLAAKP